MYVHWKSLLSFGFAFWGLLCCTDLLGDSTWKRCSGHLEDILKGQFNEITRMQSIKAAESTESQKHKLNWPILLWNICAFLCSLVFCSVIRSMSWFVWKLFKIYNVFRNRKVFTNKLMTGKISDGEANPNAEITDNKTNCKVLFKNQMFVKQELKKQESLVQEHINLSKELDEIKKEKNDLSQQLVLAQKENLTARQQIEEYKLETFMMKEKLTRTTNSLNDIKHKDYTNVSQEMISRKAHSLEIHLKEVSRDREMLRSKLSSLEKCYSKLEERLKLYEKQDSETNLEQFPEKDISTKPSAIQMQEVEITETDVDICKFQKKIMALQRSIGTFDSKKSSFETNSKISVDLDESSMDTSKENDSELQDEKMVRNETKRADINLVKQNILNYNAYKAQMLRPKLKLANIKERLYSATDTTGSSSDENSGPQRIISSTVEFQNFLKTLTSTSTSSLNFKRNIF